MRIVGLGEVRADDALGFVMTVRLDRPLSSAEFQALSAWAVVCDYPCAVTETDSEAVEIASSSERALMKAVGALTTDGVLAAIEDAPPEWPAALVERMAAREARERLRGRRNET